MYTAIVLLACLTSTLAQRLTEAENYQQKLDWITRYNTAITTPNAQQYIQNITLGSQFFTEDAVSRIDVAGIFQGARHNVEYR